MRARLPIIAAAAGVAIPILFAIFLFVLPKMGEVTQTEEQVQAAQDEELSLQAQLRALQQAQAAAPETEAAIAQIQDQIPPTADLPALFVMLQGAADQAAVDFFSFSPGAPAVSATGDFSTITSSITVTGSYFALDEYLFLLETLPRAAKVTTIAVSPGGGAEGTTTTSSSLTLNLSVDFFTSDTSAGPGSVPGPSTPGA